MQQLDQISLIHSDSSFRNNLRAFIGTHIHPIIDLIEDNQEIDDLLFSKLACSGLLGANILHQYGGRNLNKQELGILHEELGKSHASIENCITVVGMASKAISRGSQGIKDKWLPRIAKGEVIPAFALTEPLVGCDIQAIELHFSLANDGYRLKGKKKWITLGTKADIFVVFARNQDKSAAFIVEKNTPGLIIKPIKNMLGFRGNMLAEITFDNCLVPTENLIGAEGSGLNMIASLALSEGRFTTAWGAVGLSQAALDVTLDYVKKRSQFGKFLKDHDLIKQFIAKMVVQIKASRTLCEQSSRLFEENDPNSILSIIIAKYHASQTCLEVTQKAVQVLGANGCHRDSMVERYYRDAKIFGLIEGSTEMLELQIGTLCMREYDL